MQREGDVLPEWTVRGVETSERIERKHRQKFTVGARGKMVFEGNPNSTRQTKWVSKAHAGTKPLHRPGTRAVSTSRPGLHACHGTKKTNQNQRGPSFYPKVHAQFDILQGTFEDSSKSKAKLKLYRLQLFFERIDFFEFLRMDRSPFFEHG